MSAVRGFATLLYKSYIAQTRKKAAHLGSREAATIKKRQFYREKMCFGPKNVEKIGFLGVFMSALRSSEISQFISNDIQRHWIVVYSDAQGVATIKQIIFSRKKNRFWAEKTSKKGVFRGFQTLHN